jgi:hypothetical protein
MHVLHLIDGASPQASATTLALLAESFGRLGHAQESLMLLGGTALRREAETLGLRDPITVSAPFENALLAWPAARAKRRSLGHIDLIHCWSVGAFSLASLAWPGTPRALTVTTTPSPRAVHWLRTLTGEGGRATMLPISSTLRRALLTGGVAEPAVHVLRPGLDLGRVTSNSRAALRESWGIDSDRIKVVAVLSDPPHAADTNDAHMAVGLADQIYRDDPTQPELRILVHPDQLNRRRSENVARQMGKPIRFIQDARAARPWETLPGCDVALAQGPHAGGLSLLWAMAAGVPIVGEATYAVSEVVEDRHSALLAKPGSPKSLSHRISQLLADAQLAWKLRDTARHEAFSFFSRQRYVQALRGVYEQVIEGKAIDIPPLPVTGGLRFAGRA